MTGADLVGFGPLRALKNVGFPLLSRWKVELLTASAKARLLAEVKRGTFCLTSRNLISLLSSVAKTILSVEGEKYAGGLGGLGSLFRQ